MQDVIEEYAEKRAQMAVAEAERENNMKTGLIASCIYYKTNFSKGYYWIPYDEYIT